MNDASERAAASERSALAGDDEAPTRRNYHRPLILFLLTVVTVFRAGALQEGAPDGLGSLLLGWKFAVPLLAILLAHEFGHFVAAVLHRVRASLPYFLPVPVGYLGTFGAVIAMPDRIRSRNALLDIGAAGPLAGMVIALPVLAIGLSLSAVEPISPVGYAQEGQSLLYLLMKRLFVGPIPAGHDVILHPTAFAGWVGFLITMINLLPWGQLDGGHIAYALLGERQHRLARWLRRGLLLLFAYNLWIFLMPVLRGASNMPYVQAFMNSSFWLIWFGITALLALVSRGADHPPFDPGELSKPRRFVAWLCLGLFVALFMPTPMAFY
jgi:membrane-associated protease RseP (regulator of RpoE activity)